jgi:hypothetical protein
MSDIEITAVKRGRCGASIKIRRTHLSYQVSQYLYRDKITIVFVDLNCLTENKFIQTTLKLLYPDRELLMVNLQTHPKDLSALLDTLSSYYSSDSNRVKFISDEICSKVRQQLNLI